MLSREKAVLGFYITKHPLTNCEELLAACATATTVDLGRHSEGACVVLGGMVTGLRTVKTRTGRNAGQMMGLVTIEDLQGKVEAVLFPGELAKFRPLLVPDKVVFVEGEVDRKREEPSLRVSKIVAEEDAARELAKALLVDLGEDTSVSDLVDLLQAHRGSCPVYLHVPAEDGFVAQIACHPGLLVSCEPALLSALAEMLGASAVCVLGPAQRPIPCLPGVGRSGLWERRPHGTNRVVGPALEPARA
jgi:DNA polymerase-3 subunit alpha